MKNKSFALLLCLLLYNEIKAASWIRLGTLTDMIGTAANCYAGASISITPDGSIIAVGQPGISSNMGQVNIYQYKYQPDESLFRWTLSYTISGENVNDQAGSSVVFSSNNSAVSDLFVVAFGEPGYSGDTGRVRIYLSDNPFDQVASWSIIGAITGENSNDKSGASISIDESGFNLIVGEPGWSGNTGRVRIYSYPNWDLIYTATGESANNRFGSSVAMNKGGIAFIVGEPGWSGNAGRVHLYGGLGVDENPPFEIGTITGHNINDQAGFSVAVYSDVSDKLNPSPIICSFGEIGFSGSDGRVRIYQYITEGFEQIGAITGENGNALGYSVSLNDDGTAIAIGAPLDMNNAGKVSVYRYIGTTWQQQGNSITGLYENDQAGYSVSLSSDGTIVGVGEPYAPGNLKQGIVRVFRYTALFKQADMIYNFLSLAADQDMSHAISPGKGLMLAEQGQIKSKCFSSTGICKNS